MPDYARPGQPQIPNDPETFKRLMITKLRAAGVTSPYSSLHTHTVIDGDRIEAVVCEARGGPFAIEAANLVDAIIDWYEAHPDSYSETSDIPTSLADTIQNWRRYGVFHLPHYAGKGNAIIEDALAKGTLSDSFGRHTTDLFALGMFACRGNHGTVLINSCAFKGDEHDIVRKSECEEEGRLVSKQLADFLVRHFPGFEQAYIVDSAAEIGIRYSRWLEGKHTLTKADYSSGKHFPDVIGRTTEIDRSPPPGRFHQAGEIPLSCLIADAPSNAICGSGKSASTDPCGLLRGQVGCMVVGEAAGTAGAVATGEKRPVTTVSIETLQSALKAHGVLLGC